MKKSIKASVEVPVTTLSAIKSMLFNSDKGVDLSSIVNDLSCGNKEDYLTAINVGLTYKGFKPTIDTTTRFDTGYCTLERYEFIGGSLILNQVRVARSYLRFNKDTNAFETEWENRSEETYSMERWLDMSTDEAEQRKSIVEQYGKKPEQTAV